MRNMDFMSIIITLFTTVIGTIFGGIVTLTVNKRFEIEKLRLNNIDEMTKTITPLLQEYMCILNSIDVFINTENCSLERHRQAEIIIALQEVLNKLNSAINVYEIELSNMLDFYEKLLKSSQILLDDLSKIELIEDDASYYIKFINRIERLIDMVATFGEEVSELKLKMLNGKTNKYWKKDIYKNEKKSRINYHDFVVNNDEEDSNKRNV